MSHTVKSPALAQPLVSVILTTRDRPSLLAIALACYQHQTYPHRELIVVDNGEAYPVDQAQVEAYGGRLLRVAPETTLGAKLNCGIQEARGALCQKMDDDDWYAPSFIESMVAAILGSNKGVCRPEVAGLSPFLFFDVALWEVRRSVDRNIPGATLLFHRDDWLERPFRDVLGDEDTWFMLDQMREGRTILPVHRPEIFLAVRHTGGTRNRHHTWTHQWDGRTLEAYLQERPLHPGGPEAVLPAWALASYRELQRDLVAHSIKQP